MNSCCLLDDYVYGKYYNNDNNSYIALYPVSIYEFAELYIINIHIHMTIKNKNNKKHKYSKCILYSTLLKVLFVEMYVNVVLSSCLYNVTSLTRHGLVSGLWLTGSSEMDCISGTLFADAAETMAEVLTMTVMMRRTRKRRRMAMMIVNLQSDSRLT